jgi:2,4-dichlorophenol 6-monooxygenase
MLFTGPGGEAWRQAAASVAADTGVDIGVTAIGPFLDLEDLYSRWFDLCGVEENGCVLVRPDLIVGWRSLKLPDNPDQALAQAIGQILGRA